MKVSKLTWMLAALIVLAGIVMAATAVKTNQPTTSQKKPKAAPETDLTNYYWYDASMTYLNRQNTITAECNLTGFDEWLTNPKTLQEYGFAPSGVSPSPYPPTPHNPNTPNKILWSHP